MKLTLINPPWYHFEPAKLSSFNLGIGYLSSYLKSQGHKVHIIDSLFGDESDSITKVKLKYQTVYRIGKSFEQIAKEIPKDSDYIAISAPFNNHATIIEDLSKYLKKRFLKIPIIVGGPYASACPKRALTKGVDYVIIGEGEVPLSKLLKGKDPKKIKGFVFEENDKIINNGMAEFVTDLDILPFPDRESLHYKEILASLGKARIRKGVDIVEMEEKGCPVITSRGCPYDCTFCSIHHINGYKWRFRSAKNVITEIHELIEIYNVDAVSILDDLLTTDKKRFNELLDGIISLRKELNKDLKWSCPNGIRIDHLNEEMVRRIKESGCNSLVLGVQNGDQKMLNLMKTYLNLDKVEETVKLCKKYDIPTAGFLIFGYPGETRKSFFKTLKYAKKLYKAGISDFRINLARAYMNTKMYHICKEKNYFIIKDIENLLIFPGDNSEANLKTPEFDQKELLWRRNFAKRHLMGYENFIYWKMIYFLEMFGIKQILKKVIPETYWNAVKKQIFGLSKKIKV